MPRCHYVKPSDFELVLPVRFKDEDNDRINLGQWIPVNNFWGQFLEAMTIVRKQDLKAIVQPRHLGSLAYHAQSIMQHMTDKQLQVIERDMLFVKEPGTDPNLHYRINQPNAFGNYEHIVGRRQKFSRPNNGDQLVFNEANPIHCDNVLWRDNKYVIPMRVLHSFYAISSEISTDLVITFNLEQDVKKKLEAVFRPDEENERNRIDRNPPQLQTIFFETPKINYSLCTYTSQKQTIEHMTMSQIKGKRTGVQPIYHERNIVVRQGFTGSINFDNLGTQFEWIIVSIIPVLSKNHRNTCATYNNERACNIVQKLTISDIKDDNNHRIHSKVYDLQTFDDQLKLYRQYCAYIINRPSNQTMLDLSNNHEVQETVQLKDFFTTSAAERLHVDMRDSSGATGKKDAMNAMIPVLR